VLALQRLCSPTTACCISHFLLSCLRFCRALSTGFEIAAFCCSFVVCFALRMLTLFWPCNNFEISGAILGWCSASLVLVELSEEGSASSHCACLRVRALHLQFNHLTTFCRLFPSGYVIWGWSGRHVPPAALLFLLTANALQTSSDSCSHQEITSRRWLRGYFSLFSLSRIVGRRESEQSLCVFACAHPCICNITT